MISDNKINWNSEWSGARKWVISSTSDSDSFKIMHRRKFSAFNFERNSYFQPKDPNLFMIVNIKRLKEMLIKY